MARGRDPDSWLNDYSYIPDRDAFRRARSDPKYDVFTGSTALGVLWLTSVAGWAGALGGTLVSRALWSALWPVPIWLLATVGSFWAARKAALRFAGQPLGFLTGWCSFWAVAIGGVAMWSGQMGATGWAYGIAGGVGFLVAIVAGAYEPDNLPSHESFFGIGMLAGPLAACAGAIAPFVSSTTPISNSYRRGHEREPERHVQPGGGRDRRLVPDRMLGEPGPADRRSPGVPRRSSSTLLPTSLPARSARSRS